jgi:predicted P-loop ATPase
MPKSFNFKQLIEQVEQYESQSERVHAAAKWYVANGFPVMPSNPGSKAHAEGFNPNNGVKTLEKVDELFGPGGRFEGYDLSLGTGPVGAGVSVIDLDVKDGLDGIKNFLALQEMYDRSGYEIEDGPIQITPSGGRHIIVQHQRGLVSSTRDVGDGVDTKGHRKGDDTANGGHFLVYPSRRKTPDGWAYYRWYGDSPKIPEAPEWLVQKLQGRRPILQELHLPDFIPEGERNDTLYAKGLHIICHGIRSGATESEINDQLAEFEMRCENYKPGMGKSAFDSAWKSKAVENELKKFDAIQSGAFLVNNKGVPIACTANVECILNDMGFLEETFSLQYDEFTMRIVNTRHPSDNIDQILADVHVAIEREYRMTGGTIRQAIRDILPGVLKRKHAVDSLRDYHEGLQWDGVDRRQDFYKAIGVTEDNRGMEIGKWEEDRFALARAMEREYVDKWMIAGVARAFEPGCKVDYILVLAGEQGCGKSTFARYLTPHEHPDRMVHQISEEEQSKKWFIDTLGFENSISHKEERKKMLGRFIIEFPEAERLTKGMKAAEMKVFLSETESPIRDLYKNDYNMFQRRCICIGTTNHYEVLVDSTGSRRFFMVDIGKYRIDTQWVYENRDQIWAQYGAMYREGQDWFLDAEQMKVQTEINQGYRVVDEWGSVVENWVSDKSRFSSQDIYVYALKMTPKDQTQQVQQRVKAIMSKLWGREQHKQVRIGDKKAKVWVNPIEAVDNDYKGGAWEPNQQQDEF